MKKIFIFLFIFIGSSAYAGGIYIPQIQPLDLGQIYEQTQRTRQLMLQNQMMERELLRQEKEQEESNFAQEAFDAGYRQGFDTAMAFNQMTLDELKSLKIKTTDEKLISLIDWRIQRIEKEQHEFSQQILNIILSPKEVP